MSLEQILKEIKEIKPFADGDADEGPIETLAGRRGRKVQATERLKQLKESYVKNLITTSQFIVVTGSGSKELSTALTSGKMGLFSADPEEFYKDLAKRVNPALYQGRRTSASDIFDVVSNHLWDKTNELGLGEYNQLIFKNSYDKEITTLSQLEDFVRTAINEQMGSEIVGIQAVNSIIDTAIEKSHASPSTSIVLQSYNDQLVIDLMKNLGIKGNRVYLVVAGETPKALSGTSFLEDAIIVDTVNKETIKQVTNGLKARKNS